MAYKLIGVGVNENIISGRSPEKFDPNGKISGAELACMLVRTMYKDAASRVSTGSQWYSAYVELANEKGLLFPGFDPEKQVSRAQCAYSISQLRNAMEIK